MLIVAIHTWKLNASQYIGCYEDDIDDRAMPRFAAEYSYMTVDLCIGLCITEGKESKGRRAIYVYVYIIH